MRSDKLLGTEDGLRTRGMVSYRRKEERKTGILTLCMRGRR
jgi:hypothetical protein